MRNYMLLCIMLLAGCTASRVASVNPMRQAYRLNEGMTKQEVVQIMGEPVKSDFFKKVDEWHYCSSGMTDQLIALYFYEGKLVAKQNYTVTLNDVGGTVGSCENFIKRGNYREPDNVIEIRRVN